MNDKNDTNFFWASYTDLMTSLFFIMLVLYILTFAILKLEQSKYKADAEQLRKIKEIQNAINEIDTTFFLYHPEYKKHVLNIDIQFDSRDDDIYKMNSIKTRTQLVDAGKTIIDLVNRFKEENIKYLVIIEGQASNDNYKYNYELSYERALALLNFWKKRNIHLENLENCELIIAGSGKKGVPREKPDRPPKNQRFLIHIIPKVGTI